MAILYDWLIRGGLAVYPERTVLADIGIDGEKIAEVGIPGSIEGKKVVDADGCYLLPGIIDPHTHPVYLDDLGALAKSAAFGGVTTVIHYAYAKPGASLAEVINEYRGEGESDSCIDFGLHGGLFDTIKPADDIKSLAQRIIISHPAQFGIGNKHLKRGNAQLKSPGNFLSLLDSIKETAVESEINAGV